MKKLLYIHFFISFSSLRAPLPQLPSLITSQLNPHQSLEQEDKLSATTKTILHLFYVTERLEPAIQLIKHTIMGSKKLERNCCIALSLFFSKAGTIETEKMRTLLEQVGKDLSLHPFLHLWDQIQSFRYGLQPQEEPLILDFAKVCIVAYQSLLAISKGDRAPLTLTTVEQIASMHRLEQIFETLENSSFSFVLKQLFETPKPQVIRLPEGTLEELSTCFAFRFYITKRLEKTLTHLALLADKKKSIFKEGVSFLGIKEEDNPFQNSIIASYFKLLLKTKQCGPFTQLVQQCKSFDYVRDATFLKEFLILLCISYKSLYFSGKNAHYKNFDRSFNDLSNLSIEELLTIIDEGTEKLYGCFSIKKVRINNTLEQILNYAQTMPEKAPTIPLLIEQEYLVQPDTFTDFVFRRYYFINRLEEILTTLITLNEKNRTSSWKNISCSLRPLFLVWKDFSAYRFITDQQVTNDFLTELLELVRSLLHEQLPQHTTLILHEFLAEETINNQKNNTGLFISANRIIMRFYHLKRLERIMLTLHHLQKTNSLYFSLFDNPTEQTPLYELPDIQHEAVVHLLHVMHRQKRFNSLFSFWNGLTKYKHINDTIVLKEFGYLITHLLTDTLQSIRKGSLPLEDLSALSLEDILNLLDILVEELPDFIEKTELNSSLAWQEWLKKYWLIGPLTVGVVGIRIFLKNREVWRAQHNGTVVNNFQHHLTTPEEIVSPQEHASHHVFNL